MSGDRFVLGGILLSDPQMDKTTRGVAEAKAFAQLHGVETSGERFEFHTYDIRGKHAPFDKLTEHGRRDLLPMLAEIACSSSETMFVLVFKRPMAETTLETLFGPVMRRAAAKLQDVHIDLGACDEKDLDRFEMQAAGLFFGFLNGLSDYLRSATRVVADEQFVASFPCWRLLLDALEQAYPYLPEMALLKRKARRWWLDNNLVELPSHVSPGLQMADVLVNTVRRRSMETEPTPFGVFHRNNLLHIRGEQVKFPGIDFYLRAQGLKPKRTTARVRGLT